MAEWLKRQTVNLLGDRRWFESNSFQKKKSVLKMRQMDAYNLNFDLAYVCLSAINVINTLIKKKY